MKESYITTAIPYVNGNPHLGHAMDYLLADTLRRYMIFQGQTVRLQVGTDEHGNKIFKKAAEQGIPVQDFVDQTIYGTANENEYLLVQTPYSTNNVSLPFKDTLLTGTYRLSFRLYDGSTLIGEVVRYIIIK